jgi:hypothetical protein
VILDQDHGFTDLFSAPFTFANNRIRQMYGLGTSQPDMFAKVDLDATQRAGILTQIGFLASYSEGTTPSIIMRGVHMARDILCVDVPPPPAAVPPLPALTPNMTNRQRVENLTMGAPCNACHPPFINPLGFAFENLDGIGKWRTTDNGQPINAKSTYEIDGQMVSFDGPVELMQIIAKSQQGNACYAKHWVEYLYGRDVDMTNMADANLVANAGAISRVKLSAKNLISNLVTTEAFVTRRP